MAEAFGGYVIVGSGAGAEKQDVSSERDGSVWRWQLECKSTQAASFGVKLGLLDEVRENCYERREDLRPGLALRFYGPTKGAGLATPIRGDWVIVEVNDLVELLSERSRLAGR